MRIFTLTIFCLVSLFTIFAGSALAQRDYLIPEEIELVRDAQEIDNRINVLVKAIDRRFAALKLETGGEKFTSKDSEKWGELPASSRGELLFDIKRIIQKAIDDIDSLAERPDSAYIEDPKDKESRGYKQLFPKAVKNLGKAAERYKPVLTSLLDKDLGNAEKGSVLDSIDSCEQILEALKKLPAEMKKEKSKN